MYTSSYIVHHVKRTSRKPGDFLWWKYTKRNEYSYRKIDCDVYQVLQNNGTMCDMLFLQRRAPFMLNKQIDETIEHRNTKNVWAKCWYLRCWLNWLLAAFATTLGLKEHENKNVNVRLSHSFVYAKGKHKLFAIYSVIKWWKSCQVKYIKIYIDELIWFNFLSWILKNRFCDSR